MSRSHPATGGPAEQVGQVWAQSGAGGAHLLGPLMSEREALRPRALPLGAAVIGAAALGGALVALQPRVVVLGLALGAGIGLALARPWRAVPPFVLGAFALLGGYMALTRGFAGFYVPLGGFPLYVGEIGLLLLLVPAWRRLRGRSLDAPVAALGIWMAVNALLTLRQLPAYGLEAIRDAAVWYYGLYALVGAAVWYSLGGAGVRRGFAVVFLATLAAVPLGVAAAAGALAPIEIPLSDAPLFSELRFDTTSMHLIGAAVFFVTAQRLAAPPLTRRLTPLLVAAALGLMAVLQVRAAFVGLAGVLVLLAVHRMLRSVLLIFAALGSLLAVMWLVNFDLETSRGVVSARSVIERQLSTIDFLNGGDQEAAPSQDDGTSGTIEWRLIWWQALVDEALADPTILAIGRGYGPDLRDALAGRARGSVNWNQGSEVGRPVRSPHNIAMTILARSGLLGLALWLLVLGTSFSSIVRATLASRRRGDRDNELMGVWLASYLAAMLLIASLGVVLESPFGAAPFFWLLGLALAWAAERRADASPAPSRSPALGRPSNGPRRSSRAGVAPHAAHPARP